MFVGPMFTRELATAPRRLRFFVERAAYVLVLLVLLGTAWQILAGEQFIRGTGDIARFGTLAFQLLAPLQLVVATFLAAVWTAAAVSQEKDRRTIVLLLVTRLNNAELVLGKLLASLLTILSLVASSVSVLAGLMLLGGVSPEQVIGVILVTFASVIVCGSLGSTIAHWRERTYQALAVTALMLVVWLAFWETMALGAWSSAEQGARWATMFSPWQAVLAAVQPQSAGETWQQLAAFVAVSLTLAGLLNLLAIWRVRAWNTAVEAPTALKDAESPVEAATLGRMSGGRAALPAANLLQGATVSQEAIGSAEGPAPTATLAALAHKRAIGARAATTSPASAAPAVSPLATREVWNNPILWREICTWAYGRKTLLVRAVYWLISLATAWLLLHDGRLVALGSVAVSAYLPLVVLAALSLLIVNMQSVTSLTSERDARAMDLLLVTDITPREFVFGKLTGALYNTKEMILVPPMVCGAIWFVGGLSLENLMYLWGGWLVLVAFAMTLGVHVGLAYENSRVAVGVSVGTLFFLMVGVGVVMRMMHAFSGSFGVQLQPFLVAMLGGGVGLYVALGAKNPSPAILLAAFACPIATFYALTSFLLGYTLAVFLVVVAAYGFASLAMLVPDVHEFDATTGRTSEQR